MTSPERWRRSLLRDNPSGQWVQWVAVAIIDGLSVRPCLEIGLADDGRWVVAGIDGSVLDIGATANYLPLFPLLEMPFVDARERLRTEFKSRTLNEQWLSLFPFEHVATAALLGRSEAWASLAFKWLDMLGPSEALCAALDVLRSAGVTQQHRHRATRLLSAWRELLKAGRAESPPAP